MNVDAAEREARRSGSNDSRVVADACRRSAAPAASSAASPCAIATSTSATLRLDRRRGRRRRAPPPGRRSARPRRTARRGPCRTRPCRSAASAAATGGAGGGGAPARDARARTRRHASAARSRAGVPPAPSVMAARRKHRGVPRRKAARAIRGRRHDSSAGGVQLSIATVRATTRLESSRCRRRRMIDGGTPLANASVREGRARPDGRRGARSRDAVLRPEARTTDAHDDRVRRARPGRGDRDLVPRRLSVLADRDARRRVPRVRDRAPAS